MTKQKPAPIRGRRTGSAWFTVVVCPRNTVRVLTLKQLFEIFSGSTRTWKELGGKMDRQILPLLEKEIHQTFWPPDLPLGPRTLLVNRTILKREAAKHAGAIGWMICQSPIVRRIKVISIRGRKRRGRWKRWPISLSVASFEKFSKKLPKDHKPEK